MRVLVVAIAGLQGLPAAAIQRDVPLIALQHSSWGRKDGAPTRAFLHQSTDGYLWALSRDGTITRFDGVRFQQNIQDGWGSSGANVPFSATVDRSGGYWVGWRFGDVTWWKGGKVRRFARGDVLPPTTVMSTCEDTEGRIWITSVKGGLVFDGSRWHPADEIAPLPTGNLFIFRAGEFGLLARTGDGGALFFLPRGTKRWLPVDLPGVLIEPPRVGPNGALYVMTRDGIASRASMLKPEAYRWIVRRQAAEPALPPSGSLMLVDRQGALWFSTPGQGVKRIRDPARSENLSPYVAGEGIESLSEAGIQLSSRTVRGMWEDRAGALWFSTEAGLDRIREGPLRQLELPGLGAILAPTQATVIANRRGSVDIYYVCALTACAASPGDNKEQPLPEPIFTVHDAPDGTRFLASMDSVTTPRLWRREGDGPLVDMPLPGPAFLNRRRIHAMAMDRAGRLWASVVQQGVFRWDGRDWSQAAGLPAGGKEVASSAMRDSRGRVWLGYDNSRVALVDGEAVRMLGEREGLRVGTVHGFLEFDGVVWISGEHGIAIFDGERIHMLRPQDPSLFVSIAGMVGDKDGQLWLSTRGELIRFQARAARDSLADPATPFFRYRRFGDEDGLKGSVTALSSGPVSAMDAQGRLYFSSDRGVFTLDPALAAQSALAPATIIEALATGDVQHDSPQDLELAAGTKGVRIDYTAPDAWSATRVQFRYRLKGDSEWERATNRRQAIFTNLGPGAYTFQVQASNEDGSWPEQTTDLHFRIVPTVYQTVWFRGACAVLAVLALWQLVRLRLRAESRRLEERLRERWSERERIARELHDTLLQSVQGLILRLHVISGQLPENDPLRRSLDATLERAVQATTEARDRIRDLRRAEESQPLHELLAAAGESLRRDPDVEFALDVRGAARELKPVVRDELYWIGHEAISNALAHSGADRILVEVDYGPKALRVAVCDDGNGIDGDILAQGGRPGHWGLSGMRERAHQIGARLVISQRDGRGTLIEVTLPARTVYRRAAGAGVDWTMRRRRTPDSTWPASVGSAARAGKGADAD